MNESRIWSIVTVVVILALVAGTWFIGVGPRLAEAAAADAELATVESQNAIHRIKLKSLQDMDANLPVLEQELVGLRSSVPQGAELVALLREMEASAAAFGVSLGTTSFSAPQPFVLAEEMPDDEQLTAAMSALDNRGMYILPANMRVVGTRASVVGFLNSLQTGQRLMLVHALNFPDGLLTADSVVEASFTLQVFALTGLAPVVEEPVAPVAEAAP